jgi:hypothetical protein
MISATSFERLANGDDCVSGSHLIAAEVLSDSAKHSAGEAKSSTKLTATDLQ